MQQLSTEGDRATIAALTGATSTGPAPSGRHGSRAAARTIISYAAPVSPGAREPGQHISFFGLTSKEASVDVRRFADPISAVITAS